MDPSNSQIATMLMRDLAFYKPNVSEYMLAYGQVDVQHEPWPVINALAKRYDSLVRQISGHTPFRIPALVWWCAHKGRCR